MRISVTSGKGISNRKLLWETNRFFNKGDPHRRKRVIPVEKYGMVVYIKPYKVSFDIYNEKKNYQDTLKEYLEFLFIGKTIGISTPVGYEHTIDTKKVNIFQLKNRRE